MPQSQNILDYKPFYHLLLHHDLLYNMAGYVALRGKTYEAYVKNDTVCIFKKVFPLIKTNICIYWKTNKRGKVIYFYQHIFRDVKLKCAGYAFHFHLQFS